MDGRRCQPISLILGSRGFQNLGNQPFKFVYQLETQIDITAASGVGESNSNFSNVVKGGLTSRNSFIGLASDSWGAIKVGKTDAPYKNSTAMMNPFSGMLGDYSVIMGNTGGDNRVEFGTRLDHSIWYELPTLGGFKFARVVLTWTKSTLATATTSRPANPTARVATRRSAGAALPACADGSFSDVISVSVYLHQRSVPDHGGLRTSREGQPHERHRPWLGPFASTRCRRRR